MSQFFLTVSRYMHVLHCEHQVRIHSDHSDYNHNLYMNRAIWQKFPYINKYLPHVYRSQNRMNHAAFHVAPSAPLPQPCRKRIFPQNDCKMWITVAAESSKKLSSCERGKYHRFRQGMMDSTLLNCLCRKEKRKRSRQPSSRYSDDGVWGKMGPCLPGMRQLETA